MQYKSHLYVATTLLAILQVQMPLSTDVWKAATASQGKQGMTSHNAITWETTDKTEMMCLK